ncbi:MAG: glycosyltransferase family 2 protein [Thermodesulfobacteriota bacterium]
MSESPLISIITPTLNSEKYVRYALESLKLQDYPNLESVIVDGGSVDNTINIVNEYPFTSVCVIPGAGIYSAINEGIERCSGSYIGLLNSDDLFEADALFKVANIFEQNKSIDIVSGRAVSFEENNNGKQNILHNYGSYVGKTMDMYTLMFGVSLINAHFFRTGVFQKIGFFDTSFKLAADREFMIRVAQNNFNHQYLPVPIYRYRIHPGSMTLNREKKNALLMGLEHMKIAKRLLNESDDERFRRLCHDWLHHSAVTAIAGAVRQRNFKEAIRLYSRQWQSDLLWPAKAATIVFGKMKTR